MAECIVCGKSFDSNDPQAYRWNHTDGKWYRFDDIGCRNRFIGNPERFLSPQTA